MAGSTNSKNIAESIQPFGKPSRFDPYAIGWKDFDKGEPLMCLVEVPEVIRERWINGWLAAYENHLWEQDDIPLWSSYHPDYRPDTSSYPVP